MKIDRLLRRSIRLIVAPCPQEGRQPQERSTIMEHSYLDIQDHIQSARQQRSAVLGSIISSALAKFGRAISRLQVRPAGNSAKRSARMAYPTLP
jgi:hypothetical protein